MCRFKFFERKKEKYDINAPKFAITGKRVGKVVKVYDGDTFNIIFKFEGKFQNFKIRCYGYNSEEIRQPTKGEDREAKKVKAQLDKQALSDMILGKVVTLDCLKFGPFGRIVSKVYLDSVYVNKWMVKNEYGKFYMVEDKYENRVSIIKPSNGLLMKF